MIRLIEIIEKTNINCQKFKLALFKKHDINRSQFIEMITYLNKELEIFLRNEKVSVDHSN